MGSSYAHKKHLICVHSSKNHKLLIAKILSVDLYASVFLNLNLYFPPSISLR